MGTHSQIRTGIHGLDRGALSFHEAGVQHKQYRELQLVCKTFRDTFTAYPVLSEAIVIQSNSQLQPLSASLPSLLVWLRSHSSSVRVIAIEGVYLDVVLAILGVLSPPLEKLITWNPSQKAMVCPPPL